VSRIVDKNLLAQAPLHYKQGSNLERDPTEKARTPSPRGYCFNRDYQRSFSFVALPVAAAK
jgi:hypothetical protein